MKAKLTKKFVWFDDGINPTEIEVGTVVDSPIAENAVLSDFAEELADDGETLQKAAEPTLNKATAPAANKRR